LSLSSSNTFTGNITVDGGTLLAANGANTGTPRTGSAFGNTTTAGKLVTINNDASVILTVGNEIAGGGDTTLPGLTFVVNAGGLLETAASNVGFSGSGDANLFGNITLNGGTFTAGNGANPSFQSVVMLGTFTIGGTTPSFINTNATNTTGNGIMLGGQSAGTHTITFNVADVTGDANTDLTVSAPLTDSANLGTNLGALMKTGSGTMLLTSLASYSGPTTVATGRLIVTGSISATSAVSVGSGATLNDNGLINTAATVTAAGGRVSGQGTLGSVAVTGGALAPGFSAVNSTAGTLTALGSVTLDNASTFNIRLGVAGAADGDSLAAGSILLDDASLVLTIGSNYAFQPVGTVYVIVNGGASVTGIGTDVFAQGNSITAPNGNIFNILYAENAAGNGGGNDIDLVVAAVPEPTTWAMFLGGLAVLGAGQILRKRKA
jgi:autotransporter-associated beta strand protein